MELATHLGIQLDDEMKYIQTNKKMETNIAGVFAAGEVADSHFRQVVTSAGMGAGAAMQAIHFLEEHPEESIKIDMTQK